MANEFDDAAVKVTAGGDAGAAAARLVAAMTLDEKLGCLDGDVPFWPGLAELSTGGYHRRTWPAAQVERLGVPGIEFADGPRGCVVGHPTCFPVSMARGATFDPDLERRVGEAVGAELRASAATFTGAVCMNLLRHPGWGRAQETYGEDPHHVGEMASAFTAGLQQHVMAAMKHFALNSMENARFSVDVTADERALHEVYLAHFRTVAERGVAGVMSAYNSVNGEWCGEHAQLLSSVLRDEWGWEGFVITDFIFGLRDPVRSVGAGLNIEMPFAQQRAMALADAVGSGELSEDLIDQRVTETVATLLRFVSVFAREPGPEVIACGEHRALAREAASASMVLVANDDLLPVDPASLTRVAVLGRLAATPNLGDGGSSDVYPPEVATPLDGLHAAFADRDHVDVVHADRDASRAEGADLVVVVVGLTKADEGEFLAPDATAGLTHLFPPMDHPVLGFPPDYQAASPDDAAAVDDQFDFSGDRRSLRLSDDDEGLIAAAAQVSDRVVVVVMGGSAVTMPWLDDVAATLIVWYPGMEGGHALADVLVGSTEPGGRLPFALPTDEAHLVPFDPDATSETYGLLHGQWLLDANQTEAHRPFGFGLGYTTFEIDGAELADDGVAVAVTNAGARPGSTVVQIYGAVPDSAYVRPPWRLVGFRRVALDSGVSTRAAVAIDLDQLAIRENGAWVREQLPIVLRVGQHAGDDGEWLRIEPDSGDRSGRPP